MLASLRKLFFSRFSPRLCRQVGGSVVILVGLTGCSGLKEALGLEDPRFTAKQLGVIINEADPLSVQIGEYYQQKRKIPPQNIIRVSFPPHQPQIPPAQFQKIYDQVNRQAGDRLQGLALTWASPFRVDCMAITTAFALGYDPIYCATGCKPTAPSPYFTQKSSRPYRDFGIRPTMAIAAFDFPQAKALIDRGVASDGTRPRGTAYLLSTKDQARNRRSFTFGEVRAVLGGRFAIEIITGNTLQNKKDVMFYFTGLPKVNHLNTLKFKPGAIADHLTSFGGWLSHRGKVQQMPSTDWLTAGATGSYGTVVEPCNFPQKFPHVGLVMEAYLDGATLLESYWRSVLWPGQGIFIGEPLARPFGRS